MDAQQERLYEAREGIDRTVQRLETIEPRTGEVQGADAQRVVTVKVTPDGRLRSIVVDHRWQDHLAPEALSAAISAAYGAAGAERLEQWTTDVDAAMALPEPANRPFPTAIADHLASLPSHQPVTDDHVLRELADVWAELEAELDGAIDGLTAKVERTHRATSPGGEASAEASPRRRPAGARPAARVAGPYPCREHRPHRARHHRAGADHGPARVRHRRGGCRPQHRGVDPPR